MIGSWASRAGSSDRHADPGYGPRPAPGDRCVTGHSKRKSRRNRRPPLRWRGPLTPDGGPRGLGLLSAAAPGLELELLQQAAATHRPRAGYAADPSLVPETVATLVRVPSRLDAQALKWNVRSADACLILSASAQATRRQAWALACARRYRKPVLFLHALDDTAAARWALFLRTHAPRRLLLVAPLAHQGDAHFLAWAQALLSEVWPPSVHPPVSILSSPSDE